MYSPLSEHPQKPKIASVAATIFNEDRSQILLLQRRDVPVWVLPGGGIEEGESEEEAIIREIFEETGFHVKISRRVGLYLPCNRLAKPTLLFDATILHGKATPSIESQDVRFFSLTHLPSLLPPPYREWIEDGKTKQPFLRKHLRSVNYRAFLYYACTHPVLVGRFLLARMGRPWNS